MRRAMLVLVAALLAVTNAMPTALAVTGVDPAVDQGKATRLYAAYFLRAPDLGGLRYWIDRLQGGSSLFWVSDFFSQSAEFRTRYGSLRDDQFVDLVYANVLGRLPDAGGRAFWVNELRTGARSRGAVMVGFSESGEFVGKTGTTPPVPSRILREGVGTGAAGTWRNVTNSGGCYWARLRGFSGGFDDLIANDFVDGSGRSIVTIHPTDAGFSSSRCGTWVPDLGPITLAPTLSFGSGTYRVGRDVAVGTWRSSPGTDGCYWARLSGFSGEFQDLLANDFGDGQRLMTIVSGDLGITTTKECGTWTKIG